MKDQRMGTRLLSLTEQLVEFPHGSDGVLFSLQELEFGLNPWHCLCCQPLQGSTESPKARDFPKCQHLVVSSTRRTFFQEIQSQEHNHADPCEFRPNGYARNLDEHARHRW